MITQEEFQEYLRIKKELELVKKVEGEIFEVGREMEKDEELDPEYADEAGERWIELEDDKIIMMVYADCEKHYFAIPKEFFVKDV